MARSRHRGEALSAVGALVLASARGSGFGGAVALGNWQRGNILDHVVGAVRRAGIDRVVVVLGPMSDEVMAATADYDVTYVIDDDWSEGLASGVRAGLDTMWREADIEAALVLEVDLPGIDDRVVAAVLAHHRSSDRPITAPKYRYHLGLPLVVDRELWPRWMGLEGKIDLIDLLSAHPGWVSEVWQDRVPPARVATPDDVEALVHRR